MAVYTLDNITKDVRIALDQNMASDTLTAIGDVDTLAINDIIKSKIVEAVKRIHCEAPAYLLDGGNNFGDAIYWGDKESGWVLLPENFMRFVVFQMDDWEQAVYTCFKTDDPEYARQHSHFKGVRGTAQRPVCFIAIRPEGRVLEFYSSKSKTAKVSRGVYLPYPTIDKNNGINICMRCYDAVVYTIAALFLMTIGEAEKGNLFNELAKSALL